MKLPHLLLVVLIASTVHAQDYFRQGRSFSPPEREGISRTWLGPEFFSNRALDWRLNNGRIECITATRNRPMRTTHALTRSLGEEPGLVSMWVELGAIKPGPGNENTWAGFLIGVGGEHVDYRISALCHQWPHQDGGLIAAIDGTGRVVFRDNTKPGGRAPKEASAWPLLAAGESSGALPASLRLNLEAIPKEDGYSITLKAVSEGEVLSIATIDGVDPQQVSGSIAIVSHNAPRPGGPGYWFRAWRVSGSKVREHPDRAFGPVISTLFTISDGVLKMTAQFPPLGEADTRTAELQFNRAGEWTTVASGEFQDNSFTVPFRVENFDGRDDISYRVVYALRMQGELTFPCTYEGTIRRVPIDKEEIVLGALTCHHISAQGNGAWNHSAIWYPHNDLTSAVAHHDPDLLYFAGDQLYEGGLAGIVRNPPEVAVVDYYYHWLRWCWAFRDLTRDRPTVCIPDDHDVYHGNIWGNGGTKAVARDGLRASDIGGYIMDPMFVNAVHATQTSHLPDPHDPTPIKQDISVYYTRMDYAGLSFAILADRMWKSPPSLTVDGANIVNGWFHNTDFDPRDADVEGAVLLGERQLEFLEEWAGDWSNGSELKVLLSQTIFCNLATLPQEALNDTVVPRMRQADFGEYMRGDKVAVDADSNGWPQSGRDAALRAARKGFALHIAGDQHLASVVHYGVDAHNDAGIAFCTPAIANVWPRRWFPPTPGLNREPGSPEYTGDHFDGFGNRITVLAVGNPQKSGVEPSALYDRSPGYGIVRFNRRTRDTVIECWPRWVDPSKPEAPQYPGWPVTVAQEDCYGREAFGYLPTLEVREGSARPVVQVIDEADGSVVYTIRMWEQTFDPPVFAEGTYSLRIGDPDAGGMGVIPGLEPGPKGSETIELRSPSGPG